MKFVKLALRRKTVPVLIEFCINIVTMMTGNPDFLTPTPALKKVTDAINALKDAYEAALDGSRKAKALQRARLADLIAIMSLLAAYVQDASGGDEVIILGAGMSVRKTPTPRPLPEVPQNVRILLNEKTGEFSLAWNPSKYADYYVLETSTTPDVEESWTFAANSARATTIVLKGLPSLKISWVRIAAANYRGQSAWSETASKVIR